MLEKNGSYWQCTNFSVKSDISISNWVVNYISGGPFSPSTKNLTSNLQQIRDAAFILEKNGSYWRIMAPYY